MELLSKRDDTFFVSFSDSVIRKLLIGAWRPLLVIVLGVELEALGP